MKIKLLILLVLGFTFYSCEEEVDDPDLFSNTSFVIINGAISPQDEIIRIRVSRSNSALADPIVDPEGGIIENAQVILSDEDQNMINLPFDGDNFYQIPATEFQISPGKSYFLKVIIEEKEYTASCKIPNQKVGVISHSFTETADENGIIKDAVIIAFDDIIGKNNYYIIGAQIRTVSDRPVMFGQQRFATDISGDTRRIKAIGFEFGNAPNVELNLQVAHVEEIIYQSLFASYSNRENDGNPFYETIIPPNNIIGEGVYGVFAGFQLTEKEVVQN